VIAKQNDLRKYGDLKPTSWVWNWTLKVFTGHGEQVWRVLLAILLVYGAAVGVVWTTKDHHGFVAVGSTAVVAQTSNPTGQGIRPLTSAEDCTSRYPCLSQWLLPVDAAVPVVNLHQADFWAFDASTTWGQAARYLFDLLTLLGWLFVSLLVATLAGLIRKG
jgi:hypothetical protein